MMSMQCRRCPRRTPRQTLRLRRAWQTYLTSLGKLYVAPTPRLAATYAPLRLEMQATVEITTSSGALFDFTKEPANTCPTPPTSHLYFQRRGDDMTGYGATEFYRWFSNPIKLVLKAGKVTLAVPFDPAQWSSVFGKFGNANAEANKGFEAALKDVANVGFTFGGGCFFGHGAFVTNGTARFIVTEFKVK